LPPVTTKFRFACYFDLKLQLGEIDAAAECLELAMREFVGLSQGFANSTAFIQELSRKHGIRVDVFDLDGFIRHAAALRLIGVTQTFEVFLDSFIEAHPRIRSREGRKPRELLLDFVIRKLDLSTEVRLDLKKSIDYSIYSYYRQIRNDIAHKALKDTALPGSNRKLEELRAACVSNEKYAQLAAPNDIRCLTFDDYVLFTRITKNLAAQLCQAGALTESELIDWLRERRIKRGSVQRQENSMKTLLRISFGIDLEVAEKLAKRIMDSGSVV
jgi:hypothetical protein